MSRSSMWIETLDALDGSYLGGMEKCATSTPRQSSRNVRM